ncbi:MAG: 1,4-alpha-glucan branching protein GlgB [Acholeplasma sp.]|nr:1,4-alpha-glucan branching protein GlgB [Acholeplasma sp.]
MNYDINKQFDLFLLGNECYAHKWMGAHLLRDNDNNIYATRFIVYAPHAKEVRLIGSFNNYEGWKHVLTRIHPQGLFGITIPLNLEWSVYKYEIYTENNQVLYKSDPFGFFAERRPANASIVYDIDGYNWLDNDFLYTKKKPYHEPVLIYEMHFGSWQKKYGDFKNYNEICDDLIGYIKHNGFTHVEFMPIYEHPLDASWGYQGTGFFAATSRFGSPKDLMYLIDRLHRENIGVIIDWVLGHINRDSHGLSFFDGSPLYEIEDKFLRENVTWGTDNLDFGKGITRSFMLSALTFWMDYFHVDGFRIDAVSNLIYYLGNQNVGENHNAINFLRQLSTHLFSKDDRLIFSAEDSTAYPKVTHPVSDGGLGFNYKWNMGFMNDTLEYFKLDPIHRKHHSNLITFSMVYAYSEQYILPFSHDEVVHMKGSLVNKMPGDYYLKMANWRLLLGYYMTFPGKKLLFMGQEFAQFSEWNFQSEIDWFLLVEFEMHQKAARYFRDLALTYRSHPALFQYDHDSKGFKWLIDNHYDSSVFSYVRKSDNETLVVILNMTPNYYDSYEIGVPYKGVYVELINSDKAIYGGADQYNGEGLRTIEEERNGMPHHIKVKLGSLAAVILRYQRR